MDGWVRTMTQYGDVELARLLTTLTIPMVATRCNCDVYSVACLVFAPFDLTLTGFHQIQAVLEVALQSTLRDSQGI